MAITQAVYDMNLRNFFISLLMLILAAYGGFKAYTYFEAKKKIDAALEPLHKMGVEVSYDRVATSIFGSVGVRGLRFRFPKINEDVSFGEVQLVHFEKDENAPPTRFHVTMDDVRFSVKLYEEFTRIMDAIPQRKKGELDEAFESMGYSGLYNRMSEYRALGLQNIKMDLNLDLIYRPSLKEASYESTVNVDDMGIFYSRVVRTNMKTLYTPDAVGSKLKEAQFDLIDHSFTDRLMKSYITNTSTDLETYRQQVLRDVDTEIATKQIRLSPESIQNLKAFISKPDKLRITMYPYEPVSILGLKHYRPGDVPVVLNLRFSHI